MQNPKEEVNTYGRALFSSLCQGHVVAGILGVSSLILAFKGHNIGDFSSFLSKSTDVDDSYFIPGLHNLGNNCFLNVILQSLASCTSFSKFTENVADKDGFSLEDMPLMDALTNLLRELFRRLLRLMDSNVMNAGSNEFGFRHIGFTIQKGLAAGKTGLVLEARAGKMVIIDGEPISAELGILHNQRLVLSPRKVMLVMSNYVSNFNLTMQQDAEEAFLLLLSSLREELLESYVPHYCTLADIYTYPLSRVCSPSVGLQTERQRWQQYLLGPFDGILCSSLVCRSCSSQLSASYEFFHSLSLTPVLDDRETLYGGPSLERCLKKYTSAELIENYRCNQCWHNAAVKYLSVSEGNETKIETLKCCSKEDSCDCMNFLPGKARLWPTDFSSAIKQLRVARCPQILCIHLQRASANRFGESVKRQGHISFPIILDLFPFTKDAAKGETGNLNMDFRMTKVKQLQSLNPGHFKMQTEKQRLKSLNGTVEDNVISEAILGDVFGVSSHNSSREICIQRVEGESRVPHHEDFTHPESTRNSLQFDNKVEEIHHMMPLKSYIYQLVSVVEHFGTVGSGHYIVYRRVKRESNGQDSTGPIGPAHWFCVSDSKVVSVSEKDVLGAHASLLFYERIEIPNYDEM